MTRAVVLLSAAGLLFSTTTGVVASPVPGNLQTGGCCSGGNKDTGNEITVGTPQLRRSNFERGELSPEVEELLSTLNNEPPHEVFHTPLDAPNSPDLVVGRNHHSTSFKSFSQHHVELGNPVETPQLRIVRDSPPESVPPFVLDDEAMERPGGGGNVAPPKQEPWWNKLKLNNLLSPADESPLLLNPHERVQKSSKFGEGSVTNSIPNSAFMSRQVSRQNTKDVHSEGIRPVDLDLVRPVEAGGRVHPHDDNKPKLTKSKTFMAFTDLYKPSKAEVESFSDSLGGLLAPSPDLFENRQQRETAIHHIEEGYRLLSSDNAEGHHKRNPMQNPAYVKQRSKANDDIKKILLLSDKSFGSPKRGTVENLHISKLSIFGSKPSFDHHGPRSPFSRIQSSAQE